MKQSPDLFCRGVAFTAFAGVCDGWVAVAARVVGLGYLIFAAVNVLMGLRRRP